MANHLKIDSRHKMCVRLLSPLLCALMTGLCSGQDVARPPSASATPAVHDDLAEAIKEVNGGNYAYVDQIVKAAGEKESVPILQNLFSQSQAPITKCFIASKLIKLGNGDEVYWNYLAGMAREALDSDIPNFPVYDENGKAIKGKISPEFEAWAKAQKISGGPWAEDQFYGPMLPLGLLGGTGDTRAIPLLRRGLLARNYLIEAMSAGGLARLKDKDSIPLIVEACKRAPAEAASAIATALLQFKDPEAQAAAEPFLPEDLVRALHDEKR
jgi:hypothetical protein